MRLYKKTYNLRQICNIAVYMLHSACTIHLLNLPEKTARRDIIHGVKHLEEIAEDWLCARRTLSILSVLARKWKCELPDEAAAVLKRTDEKYGHLGTAEVPSPIGPNLYTPSPPAQPPNGQDATTLSDDFLSTVGSIPNAWAMSSGVAPPAMPPPQYYQPFTPLGPSPARLSTGTRHRSSNASYALDGKDWFLKDSVNLQQNFESWGMGAMTAGTSSGTNTNNSNNNNNDNNTSTIPSGDVFLFKGLQESDMDLGEGWDFDSSMTNLDMIPGLDTLDDT